MSLRRRWVALSIVAGGVAMSWSVLAQEAPRLPKPRPAATAESRDVVAAPVAAPEASKVEPAPVVVTALPRPRPSIDPAPFVLPVTQWAEQAEVRFREAAAATADIEAIALQPAPHSLPAAGALEAIDALARLPRPRPGAETPLLAMVAPGEIIGPVEPPPPMPRPPTQTAEEYAACLIRLQALGVEFTEVPPIDPTGSCNVDRPLSVTSVGKGVTLAPEAILNCETAEALAQWSAEVVSAAAKTHLSATPTRINHASTYVCRPRNNLAGEQLSEHAYANAVDIASIDFADRSSVDVRVRNEADGEAAFQREIRTGSCTYFTTVLGPGSNAAHATHFHFDMAERRGGYRLCDLGEAIAAGAPAP